MKRLAAALVVVLAVLLMVMCLFLGGCAANRGLDYLDMDRAREEAFEVLLSSDICGSYVVGFALTLDQSERLKLAVRDRCAAPTVHDGLNVEAKYDFFNTPTDPTDAHIHPPISSTGGGLVREFAWLPGETISFRAHITMEKNPWYARLWAWFRWRMGWCLVLGLSLYVVAIWMRVRYGQDLFE